jgi:hypothetical protein
MTREGRGFPGVVPALRGLTNSEGAVARPMEFA